MLQRRTQRFVLVLEQCSNDLNYNATLRTADAMGVQHVWLVRAAGHMKRSMSHSITRGTDKWLSVRWFDSAPDCVAALRDEGCAIWAADLAPTAKPLVLGPDALRVPPRLGVVMGRELDGLSDAMRASADALVYLPMHGFSESFNLSVATALVLQRLFDLCPEARGDMPEAERAALRARWFSALAGTPAAQQRFSPWVQQPGLVKALEELRVAREDKTPRALKRMLARSAASLSAAAAAPTGSAADSDDALDTIALAAAASGDDVSLSQDSDGARQSAA